MGTPSRSLRWLQVLLTVFYGQVVSTSIYQYIIQGITGFISQRRTTFDSLFLLLLGIFMITFSIYAVIATWFHQRRPVWITCGILIFIFLITLAKSISEILSMLGHPLYLEWILVRISELIFRLGAMFGLLIFIACLRRGYEPENLE